MLNQSSQSAQTRRIQLRISAAFPSDYLKAADLMGRAVTVIMSHVDMATIGDGHKPILYFQGKEKGMVLNKTNAKKISEMFGDNTDDWTGGEIILYEAMVEFQGNTVPGLRVRLAPRKAAGHMVNGQRSSVRDTDAERHEAAVTRSHAAEIVDDSDIPF